MGQFNLYCTTVSRAVADSYKFRETSRVPFCPLSFYTRFIVLRRNYIYDVVYTCIFLEKNVSIISIIQASDRCIYHRCSNFCIKNAFVEKFLHSMHIFYQFDDIAYRGKITSIKNVTVYN